MSGLEPDSEVASLDTNVPHIARVYNFWLGGKDNYEADREAAEKVRAAFPDITVSVRAQRAFLGRAVHYLVAEAGIRQFLDIGTGLPSADNTHEVAQRTAPESRVVYVDNDPIVLAHARALLTSNPAGATDYIDGDLRDTSVILQEAARTLDFGRPVAVMLLGVLHCLPDEDDPHALVAGCWRPSRPAATWSSRTRRATSPPRRCPGPPRSTTPRRPSGSPCAPMPRSAGSSTGWNW